MDDNLDRHQTTAHSCDLNISYPMIIFSEDRLTLMHFWIFWIYGENVSSCKTNTWEIFDHRSLLKNIFLIPAKLNFHGPLVCSKGTFYSESAGEIWNRHVKVLKIVSGLLFPVNHMISSNKMLIFKFFCANKINLIKARTNMW